MLVRNIFVAQRDVLITFLAFSRWKQGHMLVSCKSSPQNQRRWYYRLDKTLRTGGTMSGHSRPQDRYEKKVNVRLTPGLSRCFGFVTVDTREQAAAVIKSLNYTQLDGKTISIEKVWMAKSLTYNIVQARSPTTQDSRQLFRDRTPRCFKTYVSRRIPLQHHSTSNLQHQHLIQQQEVSPNHPRLRFQPPLSCTTWTFL